MLSSYGYFGDLWWPYKLLTIQVDESNKVNHKNVSKMPNGLGKYSMSGTCMPAYHNMDVLGMGCICGETKKYMNIYLVYHHTVNLNTSKRIPGSQLSIAAIHYTVSLLKLDTYSLGTVGFPLLIISQQKIIVKSKTYWKSKCIMLCNHLNFSCFVVLAPCSTATIVIKYFNLSSNVTLSSLKFISNSSERLNCPTWY